MLGIDEDLIPGDPDSVFINRKPSSASSNDSQTDILLRVEKLLSFLADFLTSHHRVLSGKVSATAANQSVSFGMSDTFFKSLLIILGSSNVGNMYIGGPNVDDHTGGVFTNGTTMEFHNVFLSDIGIYADTAGDSFTWVGEV